jgi:hypothetical protein
MKRKATGLRLSLVFALLGLVLGQLLSGCGKEALLTNVSVSAPVLTPNGQDLQGRIDLQYSIQREAKVSISVVDSSGQEFHLRSEQDRSAGPHALRFNGAVPIQSEGLEEERVLSDGDYSFVVVAVDAKGVSESAKAGFRIQDADTTPPEILNLTASPTTISPNGDAVNDLTVINYRLTKEARVTVRLTGPNNYSQLLEPPENKEPGEYRINFSGKTAQDRALADGDYEFTVEALDKAGNLSKAVGKVTLSEGGQPVIEVLEVELSPTQLMRGSTVTVKVRLKNSGQVTLRSQGPGPGFTYTTYDTFASVEGGRYAENPGLWRVGVDWEGNSGSGPRRYPFRWGFGKDLAPGEEVTVVGHITILQPEREMAFYVGVIHEGVGFPVDRVGRWVVQVGQ